VFVTPELSLRKIKVNKTFIIKRVDNWQNNIKELAESEETLTAEEVTMVFDINLNQYGGYRTAQAI